MSSPLLCSVLSIMSPQCGNSVVEPGRTLTWVPFRWAPCWIFQNSGACAAWMRTTGSEICKSCCISLWLWFHLLLVSGYFRVKTVRRTGLSVVAWSFFEVGHPLWFSHVRDLFEHGRTWARFRSRNALTWAGFLQSWVGACWICMAVR